jgi:hypothetical protein
MHVLFAAVVVLLATATASAAPRTRTEFAALIAKVKPGMTADQVKQTLGPPDDIKTERDPGGITAARTVEVWRYGAARHLAFGTLGTIHVQADRKVQYVFGGTGTPFTGMPEAELRRLLELVDAVPSYNAVLEPLSLIRAVNALLPLGKTRALEVVDEYLRVSSSLDDPGREGVFLLMRVLFDPPVQVPMMVGGPTLSPPADPKALPRFPLILVDDVPYKLVNGYMLGGHPQDPESDVAAFRKAGTLRTRPLAPTPKALDALDAYVAGPLAAAIKVDDGLRVALYDQGLRFFGTVFRPATHTVDSWFPDTKDLVNRWKQARLDVAKVGAKWDARTSQLVLPNGSTLPPLPGRSPRVWWDLALAGTTKARATFERLSDQLVSVELRLELVAGGNVKADVLRVVDAKTNTELARVDFGPVSAPGTSTAGSVSTRRLQLPRGTAIKLALGSGAAGPMLTP